MTLEHEEMEVSITLYYMKRGRTSILYVCMYVCIYVSTTIPKSER